MIKHLRIDNRLLHGIVASQWYPKIGAFRIMVIDDVTANDPMKKDSMKLGKPAGSALSIINTETAINNFKNNKYGDQTIFVIVRDLNIVSQLVESNIKIDEINIGATVEKTLSNVLSKFASFDDKEYDLLKSIGNSGIKMYSQYVPSNSVLAFKDFK